MHSSEIAAFSDSSSVQSATEDTVETESSDSVEGRTIFRTSCVKISGDSSEAFRFDNRLKEADIPVLCTLTATTGFFSPAEVDIVRELAEASVAQGTLSGYHFLVARQNTAEGSSVVDAASGIFGFACFGPVPCTDGSWHLYWIVVADALRGNGLGKRLLSRVERIISVSGGRKLFLETSSRKQYEPTCAFYERNGYLLEACLKGYYTPHEDCLMYSKVLASD